MLWGIEHVTIKNSLLCALARGVLNSSPPARSDRTWVSGMVSTPIPRAPTFRFSARSAKRRGGDQRLDPGGSANDPHQSITIMHLHRAVLAGGTGSPSRAATDRCAARADFFGVKPPTHGVRFLVAPPPPKTRHPAVPFPNARNLVSTIWGASSRQQRHHHRNGRGAAGHRHPADRHRIRVRVPARRPVATMRQRDPRRCNGNPASQRLTRKNARCWHGNCITSSPLPALPTGVVLSRYTITGANERASPPCGLATVRVDDR